MTDISPNGEIHIYIANILHNSQGLKIFSRYSSAAKQETVITVALRKGIETIHESVQQIISLFYDPLQELEITSELDGSLSLTKGLRTDQCIRKAIIRMLILECFYTYYTSKS